MKSFAKFPLTVTVFFEKSDNILNFARFAVLKTGFFIYPEYKNVQIMRCVSIFGGNCTRIPHRKVLFYLADNGKIIINGNAPKCIRKAFEGTGVQYDN